MTKIQIKKEKIQTYSTFEQAWNINMLMHIFDRTENLKFML